MEHWKHKLSDMLYCRKGETSKHVPIKEFGSDEVLKPNECGEAILHLTKEALASGASEVVFLGERKGFRATCIVEADEDGTVSAYLPLSFQWVYRIGNVTGLILFNSNNIFEISVEVNGKRKTDSGLAA